MQPEIGHQRIDAITEIGLDNVHRISNAEGREMALKGSWVEDGTFVIHYHSVGYTNRGSVRVTLKGNEITYAIHDIIDDKFILTGQTD